MGAASAAIPQLITSWICLTLAATFVLWTAFTGLAELQDAQVAMARYFFYLTPAALGAGAVCAGLLLIRLQAWLPRLSYAAGLCYLAAFAVTGLPFAPWVAAAAALVAAALPFTSTTRIAAEAAPTPFATEALPTKNGLFLLVHVMGTLTGMQIVFRLPVYLEGREPFMNVLRGFWLLTSG